MLRVQLDADHFGLDQVKRRLIEYLAIVKLRATADATSQISYTSPHSNTSQLAVTSDEATDQHRALIPHPSNITSRSSFSKKKGVKGPVLLYV